MASEVDNKYHVSDKYSAAKEEVFNLKSSKFYEISVKKTIIWKK